MAEKGAAQIVEIRNKVRCAWMGPNLSSGTGFFGYKHGRLDLIESRVSPLKVRPDITRPVGDLFVSPLGAGRSASQSAGPCRCTRRQEPLAATAAPHCASERPRREVPGSQNWRGRPGTFHTSSLGPYRPPRGLMGWCVTPNGLKRECNAPWHIRRCVWLKAPHASTQPRISPLSISVRFAYRGAAAARFAGLSSEAPSEGRFGAAVAVFFMEKGMVAFVHQKIGGRRKQQRGRGREASDARSTAAAKRQPSMHGGAQRYSNERQRPPLRTHGKPTFSDTHD